MSACTLRCRVPLPGQPPRPQHRDQIARIPRGISNLGLDDSNALMLFAKDGTWASFARLAVHVSIPKRRVKDATRCISGSLYRVRLCARHVFSDGTIERIRRDASGAPKPWLRFMIAIPLYRSRAAVAHRILPGFWRWAVATLHSSGGARTAITRQLFAARGITIKVTDLLALPEHHAFLLLQVSEHRVEILEAVCRAADVRMDAEGKNPRAFC